MKKIIMAAVLFWGVASFSFAQDSLLPKRMFDLSLESRVEKLEHEVENLKSQMQHNDASVIQLQLDMAKKHNELLDALKGLAQNNAIKSVQTSNVATANQTYPTQWFRDASGREWRYLSNTSFQKKDSDEVFQINNSQYYHDNHPDFNNCTAVIESVPLQSYTPMQYYYPTQSSNFGFGFGSGVSCSGGT